MILVPVNMSRFGFSSCKKICRKKSLQNILKYVSFWFLTAIIIDRLFSLLERYILIMVTTRILMEECWVI